MANGHGGTRQGAPGASYAQRTDLLTSRAPTSGAVPPVPQGNTAPAQAGGGTYVEDTPFLFDKGNPGVPMTSGLPTGPGAGAPNPARDDLDIIRKYLPDLKAAAKDPEAPITFKALVRYLSGGV